MLCGDDCVARRRQHLRNVPCLEIPLRAQYWEIEFRRFDTGNLMSTENRPFGIGIGQRVAEPISGGIRVALNNRDASRHGWLTLGWLTLGWLN